MGVRLFAEVLDYAPATLTHRERYVLAVLADDANDETRLTWSSVESPKILRRAHVSRAQLYEVLKALIAKGTLKRESAGQKHAIAKYSFLPLALAQCPDSADTDAPSQHPGIPDTDQPQRPETPDTDDPTQRQENRDTDDSQCPETPDVSVRESRTPTSPSLKRDNKPSATADPFDVFWTAYPKKIAKGQARKAFAAALRRGATADAIAAAATRHADAWRTARTDSQWIPYASTWLNGERYDDEQLPTAPSAPKQERWADGPHKEPIF